MADDHISIWPEVIFIIRYAVIRCLFINKSKMPFVYEFWGHLLLISGFVFIVIESLFTVAYFFFFYYLFKICLYCLLMHIHTLQFYLHFILFSLFRSFQLFSSFFYLICNLCDSVGLQFTYAFFFNFIFPIVRFYIYCVLENCVYVFFFLNKNFVYYFFSFIFQHTSHRFVAFISLITECVMWNATTDSILFYRLLFI